MEKQESEILEGQLEMQKLKCELEESKQTEVSVAFMIVWFTLSPQRFEDVWLPLLNS